MLKHRCLAVAVVVLGLALAAPASAGVGITVSDDFFTPPVAEQGATLTVGWDWSSGLTDEHNVREDSKLFRSGAPTSDENTLFIIQPSAGTFHYYCENHGSKHGGMDGVLEVKPFAENFEADQFDVRWSNGFPASGDTFDVRWKGPGSGGKFKTLLKNTGLVSTSFGANDDPVEVQPGKTYKFQARSKDSSNLKQKRSDWSPTLKASIN